MEYDLYITCRAMILMPYVTNERSEEIGKDRGKKVRGPIMGDGALGT